jgi:hypothetical protein
MLYDNHTCPCPKEDVDFGLCACLKQSLQIIQNAIPDPYKEPMTREDKIQEGFEGVKINDIVITSPPDTIQDISNTCNAIKAMLIEKNRKYGDSALSKGIVFPLSPVLSLKSRINDKLARLRNDNKDEDEDVISDLLGYLILLKIAIEREKR